LRSARIQDMRAEVLEESTMTDTRPTPQDRFTFGLWTVGNPAVIPSVPKLARPSTPLIRCTGWPNSAAYGVNFHDNDLVPFGRALCSETKSWRAS